MSTATMQFKLLDAGKALQHAAEHAAPEVGAIYKARAAEVFDVISAMASAGGADQAALSPPAGQEPVAWMWQHEETGLTGFVQHAPEAELRQWERMNRPRKIVAPLFAHPAQHQQDALDARRYRWLRAQHWNGSKLFVVKGAEGAVRLGTYCPSKELLDTEVDAALPGEGGKEGGK